VRDIVVHSDDLAIATYGRGFWVLDQMSPLRQLAADGKRIEGEKAYLFGPGETMALHNGSMNGTPLPHEDPQELNPPAGVVAYYWLKIAPAGPLKIELIDARNVVRACLASDIPVKPVDTEAINVQAIWEQPAPPPSATAGTHRVALNVRSMRGFGGGRPAPPPPTDACNPPGSHPAEAPQPQRRGRSAPGLQPGNYTVRLTVDGQTYSQPINIKPDPRGVPESADNQASSNND
jgi:hypothetical protein